MSKEFKNKLKQAELRVEEYDKLDGCQQIEFGAKTCLQTCLNAIESGISTNDESPILDAYVMLKQFYTKISS